MIELYIESKWIGGSVAQWLAYLLPDPAALGSIPSITKKNSDEKNVGVAEVNQRRGMEESEQWLENVDWTDLILVSGKLVLHKKEHNNGGALSEWSKAWQLREQINENHKDPWFAPPPPSLGNLWYKEWIKWGWGLQKNLT